MMDGDAKKGKAEQLLASWNSLCFMESVQYSEKKSPVDGTRAASIKHSWDNELRLTQLDIYIALCSVVAIS